MVHFFGKLINLNLHRSRLSAILESMKAFPPCQEPECDEYALTESDYCHLHDKDPEKTKERINKFLLTHQYIENANFSGISISGLNLRDHKFHNCLFRGSLLTSLNLENCEWKLCFLDFSRIMSTLFTSNKMHYIVFTGSMVRDCDFRESDIVNCNFNGAELINTDLSNCDFYLTRFIRSRLIDIPLVDCNLKKTDFRFSEREKVSFKYSNYEEAIFEPEVTSS